MKLKPLIIAACLGTALTAGTAFADPGKGPRHMADPVKQAEHMQKTLQLDESQRQQVQQILEQSQQQREALAQKYTIAERDAYHKEAKELHKQNHEKIQALLTPAQREALAAQKGRHGKHHGDKHRGGKHHADKKAEPAS